MKKQLIASAVACAVGLSSPIFASDTATSIRGVILDPQGEGAAKTTIMIKHEPTGDMKTISPNEAGSFVVSGLRVGGPYTIVIDSEQYQDTELTNVYLELGQPFQIREQLRTIDDSNKVVITASAANFRYPNSGSSSTFGADDIANSPSLGRDLKDILRRNPLVNIGFDDGSGMSIAGNNPRFNSISVDGVRQDDDFGLNSSGYPTLRSPVSIDAVEQISVQTNPFDAKDGGFTGGKISIVTKSGTNTFKGSAFFEKADGSWTGDPKEGSIDALDEKTWGFNFGGPAIQDKLFYYVNYEQFERSQNPAFFDIPQNVNDRLDELRDYVAANYSFNIGSLNTPPVEVDKKMLMKLDWDINEFHRASFTYQNSDGELTAGWPRSSDTDTLELSSSWYTLGYELTTFSAHWYSDWSANFSTEMKLTYKDTDNKQDPLSGLGIGAVTIRDEELGYNYVFGPDRSRHANNLSNDTFSFNLDGKYLFEEHTLSFGWQHEELDVFNIFIQDALGVWEFDSYQDFNDGVAAEFAYQNADTNNPADGAADFSYTYDNAYVQNTWDYSLDLELNFGLRYEHIHSPDRPRYNPNFVERYGFANNESLDGRDLWLPRFSFRYTGFEDVVIRGGAGIFSGGRPNVWISNAFSNDGVTVVRPLLGSLDPNDYLTNVRLDTIPGPVQAAMQAGDGDTTPIDPNFKIPTHWQYSLGADWSSDLGWLGDQWDLSAEVIFKNIIRDVRWVDLARGQVGTTPDGRPIYAPYDPVTNNPDHFDIMLTNGKGGQSLVTTLSAFKKWDNGLKLDVSYTNQNITELVSGGSSTAASSYQFTTVYDRQNPTPATASYETEHSLKLNLDYATELFENYTTNIGLFVQRSSGRPYSWTLGSFRDDDFGDQDLFDDSDVYLPYIPTGPNDPAVDFDCLDNQGNQLCLTYEEIIAHLEANGLSTEGGYLSRNAYRSPWNTQTNLSIRQEVPGLFDNNKGEVYFTIFNLLNLIDSSKGDIYYNRFADTQQILFDYDLNEDGQYQYQVPFGGYRYGSPATYRADKSVWRLKAGFKFTF